MFPSLRFMFAAVLSTLVILVIASSALVSTRRLDMPVVLHPVGSRPLAASWLTDDMQSFEARFGPQAMLINASVRLPPKDPAKEPAMDRSHAVRIEFVATANAAIDPAKPVERAILNEAAAAPAAPAPVSTPAPAPSEEPLSIAPQVAAAPPPELPASLPAAPIVVAAIEPAPVPAKDPQVASDAPAQPSRRTAALLPAAPAVEGPAFSDTSRTEPIVKPAVKKRAQIKRSRRRVARAPAPPAKPPVQPLTNPFAALFGSTTTP